MILARTFHQLFIVLGVIALATSFHAEAAATNEAETIATSSKITAPWTKPRDLSEFEKLLNHSPFSLATAEESSPLSERYMITGVMNIDGENEIFVFDHTDQSHTLVTSKPNAKSLSLVQIIPQDDPSLLKATITANGETGVISNIDTSTNANTAQHSGMSSPGQRQLNPTRNSNSYYPSTPQHYSGGQQNMSPNQPINPNNPNSRRVIRRSAISPQQNQPQQNNQGYPNNLPHP